MIRMPGVLKTPEPPVDREGGERGEEGGGGEDVGVGHIANGSTKPVEGMEEGEEEEERGVRGGGGGDGEDNSTSTTTCSTPEAG